MNHRTTSRFWQIYETLPVEVQQLADKNFQLLKANPQHPSLHLKKVDRFWSARIGLRYRALAVQDESTLTWFWIGDHDEYDRLISQG